MNRQAPQQHKLQLQKLREYLRRKPGDNNAWLQLAGVQLSLRMLDDAAASIGQALRIHPGVPNYFVVLAEIRIKQGRFNEAIDAATQAIRLDDKLFGARGIRGEAYRLSGHFRRALSDFQEVKSQQPDNPELLNKIGTCLVRLEDFEAAEQYFTRAVELNSNFTVARLNLGFLCATQLKSDEAIMRIGDALKENHLDPAIRQSAQTTLEILIEQKRLQPALDRALKTKNMDEFQIALNQVPATLNEADPQCVADLWDLAALCRVFVFDPGEFQYAGDTVHLPFIKACGQVRIQRDAKVMASLFARLTSGDQISGLSEEEEGVVEAWCRNRDRLAVSEQPFQLEHGEARLRYWHARLMASEPEKRPGQFKAIPNTVGLRKAKLPVSPAAAVGTAKIMLSEIAPTVPAGVARGVFMYIAICMVHLFNDGNGRLARFLMAWEFENAGLSAIIIPQHLESDLEQGLDKALFENSLNPIYAVLRKGHRETDRLLGQLTAIIAEPATDLV